MIKFISLLWSHLLWSSVASSLGTTLSTRAASAGDLCRVWGHQSAMLDGWIYVDNAYVTLVDTVASGEVHRLDPFGIDLRSPFGSAESIYSGSDIYFDINVTDSLPVTMRGAIWADKDETVYKYGGYFLDKNLWEVPATSHQFDLRPSETWALETKGFTWSKLPTPGGDPVTGSRSGGAAYSPALGLGFIAGGKLDNQTDSKFANWTDGRGILLDTMLTYDMGANSYTNATTPFSPFALDTLIFVPVGPKGILLSLGGYSVPPGAGFYRSAQLTKRELDSISIYDISKQSWYTQRASGQIPRDRYAFCAAVAAAADNSSYSIIIHGGLSMDEDMAFADTYVLSLPSFEYFQLDKGDGGVHRYDHSCQLQQNKLFVLGGRDFDQGSPGWVPWKSGSCDPNGFINILDVNTFTWDANYNPNNGTKYQVHKTITDLIGGNGDGCATMHQPEAGWENAKSRLQELFAGTAGQSRCSTPSGNSDPPTADTPTVGPPSASPSAPKPSGAGRLAAQGWLLYGGLLLLGIVGLM